MAAAIEGAFFGVTSVAVSLEFDEQAQFDKAAHLACGVIRRILDQQGPEPQLYNLNIPTAALAQTPELRVVPMDVGRYGDRFEQRHDPRGRDYYWLTGGPQPPSTSHETDLSAIAKGLVALTPLDYNMTKQAALAEMEPWQFELAEPAADESAEGNRGMTVRRRTLSRAAKDGESSAETSTSPNTRKQEG